MIFQDVPCEDKAGIQIKRLPEQVHRKLKKLIRITLAAGDAIAEEC